jgi:hypothetical protein
LAGSVGSPKNENDFWNRRQVLPLVCSSGQRLAIAPASRHPALLGLGIFSYGQGQVDGFAEADEFLFLFVIVLVFAFGPGKLSIDWLIKRKASPNSDGT